MDIKDRKQAFEQLGNRVREYVNSGVRDEEDVLDKAVVQSVNGNAWFNEESVALMLRSIAESLQPVQLNKWVDQYKFSGSQDPRTVAVVMAGNLPAVGFHDFLSVLMSGHSIQAKLSSDDKHLIPAFASLLTGIEPAFGRYIEFTEEKISGFDAVIATGSNNTSRYFNYYFAKYPNIIRKNRNGIAVLTGRETGEQLKGFGEDIFSYYGLGCRNVSKLFIPADYDVKEFLDAIQGFAAVGDHHKYRNNYDYNKSIFLVNGVPHFDNGFVLLREDTAISSPVSVLHYERYDDAEGLNFILNSESENIQCIVSIDENIHNAIPPGTTQFPKLWDYADGVDTMEFLLGVGR